MDCRNTAVECTLKMYYNVCGQIQGEWAQQFSTLPANTNAVEMANEFNQKIAELPAQDIDWSFVTDHLDDWCEEIELNYIP